MYISIPKKRIPTCRYSLQIRGLFIVPSAAKTKPIFSKDYHKDLYNSGGGLLKGSSHLVVCQSTAGDSTKVHDHKRNWGGIKNIWRQRENLRAVDTIDMGKIPRVQSDERKGPLNYVHSD